jgi:chromate transporter
MPLIRNRDFVGLFVMLAVFIAIGLLRLPLPAVLLVAIPLSIGMTLAIQRRVSV